MGGIGTLRETSLHAALKAWYARPGDELEATLEGYVVDVRHGETVLEIQTGHFSQMKPKLNKLLERHPVRLVYPVAAERWIVRLAADRQRPVGRRKSPRRGSALEVFEHLVSFPELLKHPNFCLEVALIREEEVRCPWSRPRRGWRRQWRVLDRRLLGVIASVVLAAPEDCLALLPDGLPRPFTNGDLAQAAHVKRALADQTTFCLRHMGALTAVGRRGRTLLQDVCLGTD